MGNTVEGLFPESSLSSLRMADQHPTKEVQQTEDFFHAVKLIPKMNFENEIYVSSNCLSTEGADL